jgi:cytochrome c
MVRLGRFVRTAGAVAALAALSACGGGDTPQQQPQQPAATGGDAAAGNGAAPAAGGQAAAEAPAPDNVETVDGTQLAQFTGDPAAGERVFAQCRTCHVTEPGVNRIGPSLHDIVGREAGRVPGFDYSPANANSGITWTPEKLFQYLENPRRVVPGTKMVFGGIPDGQRRADLIAWLQTQS